MTDEDEIVTLALPKLSVTPMFVRLVSLAMALAKLKTAIINQRVSAGYCVGNGLGLLANPISPLTFQLIGSRLRAPDQNGLVCRSVQGRCSQFR